MKTVSMSYDGKLYCIPAGDDGSFSCLGIDVAYNRAVKIAEWCGCEAPNPELKGTIEGYNDYERVNSAAYAYHRATNKRCPALLNPKLRGWEGCRVEVTSKDGDKRRFWVGMSTGWLPIHLEVARRDSTGGMGTYVDDTDTVRVVTSDMSRRQPYINRLDQFK